MSWPKGPRGKRRIWRKQRIWRKWQIWRKFAKGFDEGNDLGRRAPSKAANLAIAANLAKMANLANLGLTKANELSQRARGKRRIWRKWQNLAKLCQRV